MDTGFEHYYIFDKNDSFDLEKVAVVECKEVAIQLEISTTEPGMLFYSGMYTSDQLHRENGQKFGKIQGVLL